MTVDDNTRGDPPSDSRPPDQIGATAPGSASPSANVAVPTVPTGGPASPIDRQVPHGLGFPPSVRLHSNRDYGRVFHRQQKAAGRWIVVLLMPRHKKAPPEARLGVMISAKTVKTAVRRHQLKRWTREFFRTHLQETLRGHDCVVLFRTDIPEGDDNRQRFDAELLAVARKALASVSTPGQRGGRDPRGKPGKPAPKPGTQPQPTGGGKGQRPADAAKPAGNPANPDRPAGA